MNSVYLKKLLLYIMIKAYSIALRLIQKPYDYYKDCKTGIPRIDNSDFPLTLWEYISYVKCSLDWTLEDLDDRLAENVQEMLRKQYDELSEEEKKILDDCNHGDGFSYVMQTFNYRLREIYMSDRVQAFKKHEEEMWK